MLETLSRKSNTSRAILYALNRWDALTRYCNDGHLEIDNLPVDRALRGVAIGRRNYLFAGADSGGERAAAIYSLIGTALCRIRHRVVHAESRAMPKQFVSFTPGHAMRFAHSA